MAGTARDANMTANAMPRTETAREARSTMKYTCSICKTESKNLEGHEVWARECGFYELLRLEGEGCLSGYVVCSKQCASALLSELMACTPQIKLSGKPSKTWKCEQCGAVLPQQDENAECETVPSTSQLVYPYEWGKYHCFCSDACLLANLRESEIITAMA